MYPRDAAGNNIRPPVWHLDNEDPEPIDAYAREAPEFLVHLAEGMFIACADATKKEWPPTRIEAIDPIDPACPIRYRVDIDVSRLTFPTESTHPGSP